MTGQDENPENGRFYTVKETPELSEKLRAIDERKAAIDRARPVHPELWETIFKKIRIDWTYDSNAIEGSTLSRGDTFYLLEYGITVQGKPLKDFLDARNHAEAIDFLHDVLRDDRPISTGLIKEINALLLSGVKDTPAINEQGQQVKKPATPGQYKQLPNHVLQPNGSIHRYVEPIHVPDEMGLLIDFIHKSQDRLHPAVIAALAHYNMVRIHPFDDGNGRGARILMNLVLLKKGYSPAIVRVESRPDYIEGLVKADSGDNNPFIEFVLNSLIDTQDTILAQLSENPAR